MMLRDFFERLADENHIPYQTEVTTGSSEDSAEMQRFGSGIPSLNYAVATRYLHTHSSELDRAHFDQAIDLLVQVLNALDSKTVEPIALLVAARSETGDFEASVKRPMTRLGSPLQLRLDPVMCLAHDDRNRSRYCVGIRV
jgi:hypothetical protein